VKAEGHRGRGIVGDVKGHQETKLALVPVALALVAQLGSWPAHGAEEEIELAEPLLHLNRVGLVAAQNPPIVPGQGSAAGLVDRPVVVGQIGRVLLPEARNHGFGAGVVVARIGPHPGLQLV